MDARVRHMPLAGLVCETPLLSRVERRVNRAPDEWVNIGACTSRMYHGHQLRLEPLTVEGRLLGWFKWFDGHYRGVEYDIGAGERLLECEADQAASAWRKKQAWEAAGAPERRRRG